jgi:hypothetical protein
MGQDEAYKENMHGWSRADVRELFAANGYEQRAADGHFGELLPVLFKIFRPSVRQKH